MVGPSPFTLFLSSLGFEIRRVFVTLRTLTDSRKLDKQRCYQKGTSRANYNNVRRIVGTDDDIRVDTTGLIYESKVAVAVAKRVRYNKGNY